MPFRLVDLMWLDPGLWSIMWLRSGRSIQVSERCIPAAMTPMYFSCGCSQAAWTISRFRSGRPEETVAAFPVSRSRGPDLACKDRTTILATLREAKSAGASSCCYESGQLKTGNQYMSEHDTWPSSGMMRLACSYEILLSAALLSCHSMCDVCLCARSQARTCILYLYGTVRSAESLLC